MSLRHLQHQHANKNSARNNIPENDANINVITPRKGPSGDKKPAVKVRAGDVRVEQIHSKYSRCSAKWKRLHELKMNQAPGEDEERCQAIFLEHKELARAHGWSDDEKDGFLNKVKGAYDAKRKTQTWCDGKIRQDRKGQLQMVDLKTKSDTPRHTPRRT